MRYFLGRISLLSTTLLLLTLLTFNLSYLLPGNQLSNISGEDIFSGEDYQRLSSTYKTEESYIVQYFTYLGLLAEGKWGVSVVDDTDILAQILDVFPATLELTFSAMFLSLIVGIPLGFIAALNYHKKSDNLINLLSLIGNSIPVFWLALICILVFSLSLNWLPVSGRISAVYDIPHVTGFMLADIFLSQSQYKYEALRSAFIHLLLPTYAIAAVTTASLVKLSRSAMIEVMDTQYIKSVRARGISENKLILKHAIRNSLILIVPNLGFQVSLLFTGAIVAESIFAWPGIGNWLIQAIFQRDYPAILGGLLILASLLVMLNILLDLVFKAFNPAIKKRKYG